MLSHFSHVLFFRYPGDRSPPGSLVHGILQARILEWAAISCSRGSSQSTGRARASYSPALAGGFSTTSATGSPNCSCAVLSCSVVSCSHGLYPARLLCPRGFSRPEYGSGWPSPLPGNPPNPGIERSLPHCRQIPHHLSQQGRPKRVLLGPTHSSTLLYLRKLKLKSPLQIQSRFHRPVSWPVPDAAHPSIYSPRQEGRSSLHRRWRRMGRPDR